MTIIYGEHEKNTLDQFSEVMAKADRGCLMADGHLGYVMPIGCVGAYRDKISPVAVGFDIACGNMAIQLDMKAKEIDVDSFLDLVQEKVSFGIGQINKNAPVYHELFDSDKWNAYPTKQIADSLKEIARSQLGTVGSGNHYVDLFEDEAGFAWIGVHFGSRGLGHKTATGFLNLAVNDDWSKRVPEQEVLLDYDSSLGHDYYHAMKLCGEYAYAGREWVCYTLADALGAKIKDEVHNHHNFIWKEEHDGTDYFVVRKGATPAFPGQRGFVGANMADNSVILEGIDSEESRGLLYSTVHGAGRIMGRRQAAGRGKWKKKDGKWEFVRKSEGEVKWPDVLDILKRKNVKLRGGGCDEGPQVYRKLEDVLEYHKGTIKILHTLKPLGVVMAGENEFDPYKD